MKDLNLLYVFEAIWRDRSVSLASESLGVTQAAVSSSLKRLRAAYGDPVFMLVGRRMEPTPLAISIAPQLLDALALVRLSNEKEAFDPMKNERSFTIRTRDIGEVVCFPKLRNHLSQEAPGIQLRSIYMPIEDTLAGLASGRIDLALGFLPALVTGIHRAILFEQNYVVLMRDTHPLASSVLTLENFLQQEHLLVEFAGSGHKVLEQLLIEQGLKNRISVRTPAYLSAPFLISQSNMLWIAPAILAELLVDYFPLVIKEPPLDLPTFEVSIYWHDRFHRDPANKWLRESIKSLFA
jgi:DNA-binding transcriptional LysR family regulator